MTNTSTFKLMPLNPPPGSSHIEMEPSSLLPQDQFDLLNSVMNNEARDRHWSTMLTKDIDLITLLHDALFSASTALQSTTLKGRVTGPDAIPSRLTLEQQLSNEEKVELGNVLTRALKVENWEELITHPILQMKSSLPSSRRVKPRIDGFDFTRAVVAKAWNVPYIGEHHYLLLNNINRMSRDRSFSNSVIILQSSGTGKSRMVDEQSDWVFTLPFKLWSFSKSKDMSYPPADIDISAYLLRFSDAHESQTHCLCLLGHLFGAVSDELARLYMIKQPTYTALARSWRDHLAEDRNRTRIYEEAVNGCKLGLQAKGTFKFDLDSVDAASMEARDQLARLLQCIDDSCESMEGFQRNHVKLMLYFDEAHILSRKKIWDGDMLDVLRLCFNRFLSIPIFVIFLSTSSNTKPKPPPGPLSPSSYYFADWSQGFITETPFDCSPMLPISPGKFKLEDLGKVEFMAQFGRPLFWTMIDGAQYVKDQVIPTIIDIARAKLLCHHKIPAMDFQPEPIAWIAVMDVLLALDFDPRRQAARRIEEELVANHMRIVFSVSEDREYFRSGYSSEPILAEAAAQQMDHFQMRSDGDRNVMVSILESRFSSGLLDQGQRREVVFRLLASEAYRRSVRKDHPHDYSRNFSKGCKLTTFIKELFSEEYADQIMNSAPDNVKSSTTFADAFGDAIVRFTHFGKVTDDTGTTTHAMFAAFVRCMAIICRSSQNIVNLLIPVLLMRRETLQESVMTGVLIQIKQRKAKASVLHYEIDQKALGFFPAPTSAVDARPYVTLVAELGIQVPISPAATMETKVSDGLVEPIPNAPVRPSETPTADEPMATSPTPSTPQILHPRDVHPRYSIFAYGCSNTVYSVVSVYDRYIYKSLLKNCDILDEHPRNDIDSLRAARTMKPLWSAGLDCYHWIEEPFLQQSQAWEDDDGGLFVGKYEEIRSARQIMY